MILNIGGNSKTLKVPELDTSYPKNATLIVHDSITSEVVISTAGHPTSYTYQWYKNGTAVSGATNPEYTFTPDAAGTITLYCIIENDAGSVTSRTATITVEPYYIYKSGDIGGWTGYGAAIWDECEGNVPSISYSGSSLRITESVEGGNSRGYVLKDEPIDFSKYSKIYFEVSSIANIGYEITASIGNVASLGFHETGTKLLDVSGVNGSYKLKILLYSAVTAGAGVITFKNIYCV